MYFLKLCFLEGYTGFLLSMLFIENVKAIVTIPKQ